MNDRDASRRMEGKMNGKSVMAMVVVGLVVLAGLVAYRLLAFELIANLRRH
ncbi:hypothetical protein GCM10027161_16680 [Microbispora hainanensis]